MRVKHAAAEGEEPYNLVALTDMVFNLLIFFMCATTFAQIEKELSVQLPHPAPFQPLSAPPRQLIVNIKEDGSAVVAGRTCDSKALSELLSGEVHRDANASVLIRADERTLMKHFAAVASLCRQAGVQDSKISYLDDGGMTSQQ